MERKTVVRRVYADRSKLYGPLPHAATYLMEMAAKYPQASFAVDHDVENDFDWNCFEWLEEETEVEASERAELMRLERQWHETSGYQDELVDQIKALREKIAARTP